MILVKWMVFLSGLISMWGIYQAVFLGPEFIVNWRHYTAPPQSLFVGGGLEFQRAVSTFVSPNTFGLYLMLILILQIFLLQTQSRSWRTAYKTGFLGILGLNIAAIILTFSRSAWLGFFVGFLAWIAVMKPRIAAGRVKQAVAFGLMIVVVFVVLVNAGLLNIEAFLWKLGATWRLEDLSTVGHFRSCAESLEFMGRNPLWIGLGRSGPRAQAYTGSLINSENSYFIVGFDLGIPGLFLYGTILFGIFFKLISALKEAFQRQASIKFARLGAAMAVFLGTHTAFLFLPYITDVEVTSLIYLGVGCLMNLCERE